MNLAVLEGENKIVKEVEDIFGKENTKQQNADLGGGADWWFVLITAVNIFFLGKNLNENIDGWMEIGRKIKTLFSKNDKNLIYIDKEAAIALAVNEISKKTNIENIKILNSIELNNRNSNTKGFKVNFSHLNYYILTFEINSIEKFIICIKSNGEIKFNDYFEETEWNYQFDWRTYDNKYDH